ncbi:MAG: lipocalin family protein [Bacillota bacterium]|nr:lipocalin family protein [Bacillota bacterium]
MRLRKALLIATLAAVACALSACASDPDTSKPTLHSNATVDLPRYMGRWYIIANIPYFAENGKLMARDQYTLRADGRIDNDYVFRRSFDGADDRWHGVGTVVPGTGNAQWSVRFWGVVAADYLVLEVAPDYSWALVGHPQRKYGYVFSRRPRMDDALYGQLLAKLAGYGYTTSRLRKVPQSP